MRGEGVRPRLITVDELQTQAEYVCSEVLRRREANVPLRRQAVLFRSASHSDILEVELAKRKIPFVKYGGLRFLEAAHIKDLLALLRWADNPRNTLAGFRVHAAAARHGSGQRARRARRSSRRAATRSPPSRASRHRRARRSAGGG